ncbi:hypothetical protein B0J17DRAFT_110632 [Rhizoctonia solani]|nr:hypothetical protein B0J17DRAFT_110632 [Rhizoctonia solani]
MGSRADELASSLGRLHNLRVLTLGTASLEPKVLIALSSLPNLESLVLEEWSGEWGLGKAPNPIDISFPQGSFSALQHLRIKPCFDPEPMGQTWCLTALALRHKFISVYIRTSATPPQVCGFVRAICRYSPFVTALSLRCIGSANDLILLST